jgi:hypothetical protein
MSAPAKDRTHVYLALAPAASFAINRGSLDAPHGEVHFRSPDDKFVVAYKNGNVWARRGGFGVSESHYREAFRFLTLVGIPGFARFSKNRIGKP